jgi:L-alanine-DL-glutamate epimerase-like enolase superfamily enzyme
VPIRDGIDMPIGSFSSLDHVIVKIATRDGLSGLGEAAVIPEFMGETLDEVLAGIHFLASNLEESDLEDPGRIHALIDRLLPAARSARAAIDEACHDIAGKRLGVPAWRLLGERCRERVDCTWTIGLKSPEATVEDAAARHAQGFRTFKIKVGKNDAEDLLKVRLVRETLGPEVAIRLDANGAYAPERALSVLERLHVYDLEMVEQPCPALELDGTARLRRALGVKVLADESVFSAADAKRVLDAGATDLVNIKIQKLGGLHPAREVADFVEQAGIACVVGSCLEAGPGVAASAHFAVTCRSASQASDLLAGLQLGVDPAAAAPFGGVGPTIHEPPGPGLGVFAC